MVGRDSLLSFSHNPTLLLTLNFLTMFKQLTPTSVLRSGIACLTMLFCLVTAQGQNAKLQTQAGIVQANGIQIAYESMGNPKAETILLISGTNAQLTMWPMELCQNLVRQGYRVVRFDNRDIGLSTKFEQAGMPDWAAIAKALQEGTKPPVPYTLDDMAADAVGLLDALHIVKAHMVGASMGGMIAQRVAYTYPQRTLSLVSIMSGGGSPTFPPVAKPEVLGQIPLPAAPSDTTAYIQRELLTMKLLSGKMYPSDEQQLLQLIRKDVQRSYAPNGLHRQGAASMAGFYAGRQAQLKTIKVPTLVIHGSDDPLVAVEAGKDIATIVPNARFELIAGMGHSLPEPLLDKLADRIVANARKSKK
jgi:pimeloyl-ACP methyl ester carboxylesterase